MSTDNNELLMNHLLLEIVDQTPVCVVLASEVHREHTDFGNVSGFQT